MPKHRYKHCFKIKAVSDPYEDVKRFMDLHGGYLELDAKLMPGEYWYYTNVDKSVLEKSILVELINETLA